MNGQDLWVVRHNFRSELVGGKPREDYFDDEDEARKSADAIDQFVSALGL